MPRIPSMTLFEGRAALQCYIVDEARRTAPDVTTFHFSHPVAHLDLGSRTVRSRLGPAAGRQPPPHR